MHQLSRITTIITKITYTVRITYSNKRLIYVVADQEEFSLNNYTEIQISGIKDFCSENETLFNQILNNGNKECNSSSNCFACINCKSCTNCIGCTNCINCNSCYTCNNCNICNLCIDCK